MAAVSVQALNRFYNRSNDAIVANWMTREDRELAIADNLAYVDGGRGRRPRDQHRNQCALVYVGFSQGVGDGVSSGGIWSCRQRP